MSKVAAKVAGFFATGVGSVGALSYFDEGTSRSLQFWINVTPIYAHYRFYQVLNRDLGILADETTMKIYKDLDKRYSEPVRDITYSMRGFYLKNAQLMSTQGDIRCMLY